MQKDVSKRPNVRDVLQLPFIKETMENFIQKKGVTSMPLKPRFAGPPSVPAVEKIPEPKKHASMPVQEEDDPFAGLTPV